MNDISEREKRTFDAFRRYILPLAAVAETISTRGASPGTTAFAAEQNFLNQEERQREEQKRKEMAEAEAIQRAIDNKYRDVKMQLAQEQLATMKGKSEREAAKEASEAELSGRFREALGGTELPDIEKAAYSVAGPKTYLETMTRRNKPDPMELLQAKLAGQESLLGKKLAGQKELLGMKTKAAKEMQQEKQSQGGKKSEEKSMKLYNQLKELGSTVPAQGRFMGVATALSAKMGMQPTVTVYNNAAKAFVSNLARMYGGEKGVLTDYDVNRMMGMMFKTTDTQKERDLKSAFWDDIVSNEEDGNRIKSIINSSPTSTPSTTSKSVGTSASSYLEEIRARRASRGQK